MKDLLVLGNEKDGGHLTLCTFCGAEGIPVEKIVHTTNGHHNSLCNLCSSLVSVKVICNADHLSRDVIKTMIRSTHIILAAQNGNADLNFVPSQSLEEGPVRKGFRNKPPTTPQPPGNPPAAGVKTIPNFSHGVGNNVCQDS